MATRLSSTRLVIIGFVGVVILIAGFSTFGLYRLAGLKTEMDEIATRTLRRAEAVSTMRMVARDRLVRLQSIYFLSEPFERDAEHMRYSADAQHFIAARDTLLALDPSPAQQRLWQTARGLIVADERLHQEAIELMFNDRADLAGHLIQARIIPLENELVAQLDAMLQLERQETARSLADAARRYRQTFALMLALALGALAAAVATAVFVVRRSAHNERRMVDAKQQAEEAADQLAWAAAHDALTGLPNRRVFEARLAELARGADEEGARHALAYVDLDRFKEINDRYGHEAGDRLLVAIAGLMREAVRAGDTVARLGGDEFGLLLPYCELPKAQQLLEQLRAQVESFALNFDGHPLRVGVSAAAVPIEAGARDLGELVHRADRACYAAKQARRDGAAA